MKKLLLINEMRLHQHMVKIEVQDDEEFEQAIEDLKSEDCDNWEDVLITLKGMKNIKVIGFQQDEVGSEINEIDYDSKEFE